MPGDRPTLEVLLPVHNEAESVEATLREIFEAVSPHARMGFIISEDGSVDGTKEVLIRLGASLPLNLFMSDDRKGYSRAVIDGMRSLKADYLLCLDSDGQCDPADFRKFWEARDRQDVAIGWRIKRADSLLRRVLSRVFHIVYQLFYRAAGPRPKLPFRSGP